MNLRRETPADIAGIREVETTAFGRPAEAALVEALRAAAALVFSGVAEVDGNIVGHIAFSPLTIEGARPQRRISRAAAVQLHHAHRAGWEAPH